MLANNLKHIRITKNLSQEEVAERLHVTRQTISKWERGLSVPDAEILVKISEIFEIPVSELLGSTMSSVMSEDAVADKLEQLNSLLAERNRRSRRLWSIVKKVMIGCLIFLIAMLILNMIAFQSFGDVKTEQKVITEIQNDDE